MKEKFKNILNKIFRAPVFHKKPLYLALTIVLSILLLADVAMAVFVPGTDSGMLSGGRGDISSDSSSEDSEVPDMFSSGDVEMPDMADGEMPDMENGNTPSFGGDFENSSDSSTDAALSGRIYGRLD